MSARESNPWDLLAGTTEPPPWQGPAHVHRLLGEDERQEDVQQAAALAEGRVCTRCGNAFPATQEHFFRAKHMRGGLRPECKACYYEMPCVAKKYPKGPKVQRQAADREPADAERKELDQLAERAADAVLQALPAWSLIEPGSAREALMRKASPGLWWPSPHPGDD